MYECDIELFLCEEVTHLPGGVLELGASKDFDYFDVPARSWERSVTPDVSVRDFLHLLFWFWSEVVEYSGDDSFDNWNAFLTHGQVGILPGDLLLLERLLGICQEISVDLQPAETIFWASLDFLSQGKCPQNLLVHGLHTCP